MSLTISLGPADSLIVQFPALDDPMMRHFKPHEVTVPMTEKGLKVIRRMLVAQRDDSARKTINFPQLPTQYLVDKWLKENEVKRDDTPVLDLEGIKL